MKNFVISQRSPIAGEATTHFIFEEGAMVSLMTGASGAFVVRLIQPGIALQRSKPLQKRDVPTR